MEVPGKTPLKVQSPAQPVPAPHKIRQAAELISAAKFPMILAGNGVIRAGASGSLVAFAQRQNIPVATTFMAKGAIPSSHPLCLGTIGLQSRDYVNCGFDRADLVICVGYDMVEYHPHPWNPEGNRRIIHVNSCPAEVDEHYILASGVIGDVGVALEEIGELLEPREESPSAGIRRVVVEELNAMPTTPRFR